MEKQLTTPSTPRVSMADRAREIQADATKLPKRKTGLLRDSIFAAAAKGDPSIVVSLAVLDQYQQEATITKLEEEGFLVYDLGGGAYEIDWQLIETETKND